MILFYSPALMSKGWRMLVNLFVRMLRRRLRNLDVGREDLKLLLGLDAIYRIHNIALGSFQRVLRVY